MLEDGARDHVARRQLGVAVHAEQEARAGLVDHHGALAAQRLGEQRQRIAAGGERGGMELHELEIDQAGAGARRHRQAVAGELRRIGGVAVELAGAAGGEDHRGRLDAQARPAAAGIDDARR